jgi:hypothetical protein
MIFVPGSASADCLIDLGFRRTDMIPTLKREVRLTAAERVWAHARPGYRGARKVILL